MFLFVLPCQNRFLRVAHSPKQIAFSLVQVRPRPLHDGVALRALAAQKDLSTQSLQVWTVAVARTTVPRPGGHVHQEASTLGFLAARTGSISRRRRAFRESDVPAWPRSGACKSRTGAGGQQHGGRDKSSLGRLEQHVSRGFKSGERF